MKKHALKLFTAAILLGTAAGCVKEPLQDGTETNTSVGSFDEIKAPADFQWSTTRTVQIQFLGKAGDSRRALLKITMPNGNSLYKKLQPAGEYSAFQLDVPAYTQTLNVSFDGQTQAYNLNGGILRIPVN